jgi:hypothetical protein
MIYGTLGGVNLYSWNGAINGRKIEVEDKSANNMQGSLYVWKRSKIEPSVLELSTIVAAANEETTRRLLESYQGYTMTLTRGTKNYNAVITLIEISPSKETVNSESGLLDTLINFKVTCECTEVN